MHNLAVEGKDGLEFIYAQDLLPGQSLYGNTSIVTSVEKRNALGLYAPLTENFNFYVASDIDMSEDSQVLVHCFANIEDPTFYEYFFSLGEKVLKFFGMKSSSDESIDGISPVAKALMKIFPTLVEKGQ